MGATATGPRFTYSLKKKLQFFLSVVWFSSLFIPLWPVPGFACARPTQQESGSGVPLPFLEDRETFSHRQQK